MLRLQNEQEQPVCSVIIPLYNKARYLQRAVESVLFQTYVFFELIIVNDGSTDNGVEVAGSFDDPRILLIHQDNFGPGAARNKGIAYARGKYVAFLDADDEWLPSFLSVAVGFLDDHGDVATVALGHYQVNTSDQKTLLIWNKRKIFNGIYNVNDACDPAWCAYLLLYMGPWATIFRREVLHKHGGFFDQWKCLFGEDQYLSLKIILNERIAILREPHVIFHTECSELSRKKEKPSPLLPFLILPEGIINSTPDLNKSILFKIFAVKAVDTALERAYHGEGKFGMDLLQQFCNSFKPKNYWKAVVYCHCSRQIIFLRRIKLRYSILRVLPTHQLYKFFHG